MPGRRPRANSLRITGLTLAKGRVRTRAGNAPVAPQGPRIPNLTQTPFSGPTGQTTFQASIQQRWQGPTPPPQALEAFGKIDPSFPGRIMRMAEEAAEHQREIENQAMNQQSENHHGILDIQKRAQWFAFALAVFFGLVGCFIVYQGHPASGATVITGVVVGLASVFLIGRKSEPGD